jgi:hypothetical protein
LVEKRGAETGTPSLREDDRPDERPRRHAERGEEDAGEGALAGIRSSLSRKIYTDLRLALVSGAYEPGDRLNIRKLAAAIQTSPTSVCGGEFFLSELKG